MGSLSYKNCPVIDFVKDLSIENLKGFDFSKSSTKNREIDCFLHLEKFQLTLKIGVFGVPAVSFEHHIERRPSRVI